MPKRGRPSIDPVVFVKLRLVLVFEGLRSERQLMRVVADRLGRRRSLGHELGGAAPRPPHRRRRRRAGRRAPLPRQRTPARRLAGRADASASPRRAGLCLRGLDPPCPAHHLAAGAAWARVRAYHATEPSVEAMRQRQVWVEPLGAETRAWHGQRRSRPRGLPKAIGEALLVAAGQNRERRPSTRGWGRRPRPGGAAGLALPAPTAPAALQ